MTSETRLGIILAIMVATFGYAYYQHRYYQHFFEVKNDPILKTLPSVVIKNLKDKRDFNTQSLVDDDDRGGRGPRGGLVHFWGTWCAPCEDELPSFIRLAKLYEEKEVHFLLLAVNDNEKKVKKFLSRFSTLPSNIIVALDTGRSSMDHFGTIKVPETYLFDKTGRILRKFIGPQEWEKRYFLDTIDKYFLLKN